MPINHIFLVIATALTLSSCANKHLSKHFTVESQSIEMTLDTGASTSLLPLSYTPQSSKASEVYFLDRNLSLKKGNITFISEDQSVDSPCIFTNGLKQNAVAGLPLLRKLSPIILDSKNQSPKNTFHLQTSLIHNFPLIPCEVDSKPFYLLLDTGSLRSVLSSSSIYKKRGNLRSIWKDTPASQVSIGSNRINLPKELPPLKGSYSVFHVPHLKRITTHDNREVIGLLGLDYILKHVTKIDLQNNTITTHY